VRQPTTETRTLTACSDAGDPDYCHFMDEQTLKPLCAANPNVVGWTASAASDWHYVNGGSLDDDVCKQCGRKRCPECQRVRRGEA
jgi:hypothetical protein